MLEVMALEEEMALETAVEEAIVLEDDVSFPELIQANEICLVVEEGRPPYEPAAWSSLQVMLT